MSNNIPSVDSNYPPHDNPARPPRFDEPTLGTCVRITTRVYDSTRDRLETHQNGVLVKTMGTTLFRDAAGFEVEDIDTDVQSYHSSSSNSSSSSSSITDDSTIQGEANDDNVEQPTHAYLFCNRIAEACYGHISRGIILKRASPNSGWDWEMTTEQCAIKELSWERVRKGRNEQRSEDTQNEIAAMQHIKECHARFIGNESNQISAQQAMRETKIIMPLDTLYDERNLYIVMPFCEGGDLFSGLEARSNFTEAEARYCILEILSGVEWLQRAGVCHRDMSLENLTTDNLGMNFIIDMGMCIRIPFSESEDQPRQRRLILPHGRCGKHYYMSPEIFGNHDTFDGHAIDIWAVGVILYMLLTGRIPWTYPTDRDYKFRNRLTLMTRPILELSVDALDLLGHMFASNPEHRPNLDQIRSHAWMSGHVLNPTQNIAM